MNGLTIKIVILASVIVLVTEGAVQYYATKYDHLDIEQILNNRRMVYFYAACLLGRGACPPQGLEFKRILPEALMTNCLRCTEKQKAVTYRTIRRLKKEYPKVWAELQAQWDPMDIYVTKFEETYKNTPSTTTSENEINLEDRFGGVDSTTKHTTTFKATKKPITKKTQKPYYPPATPTTRPTTPVSNVGSASDNNLVGLPLYKPIVATQNFGGTTSTNQVGVTGPNQDGNSGDTTPSPTTVYITESEVNIQTLTPSPSEVTPTSPQLISFESSSVSPYTSKPSENPISPNLLITTLDDTALTSSTIIPPSLTPLLDNVQPGISFDIPPSSVRDPQVVLSSQDFIANSTATPYVTPSSTSSTTIPPSLKPLVDTVQPGISFDIPPSSVKDPQAQTFIPNSKSPTVTSTLHISLSSQGFTSPKPITNRFQTHRQPDVITQVLSSFLNNNRPPTLTIEASYGRTNSTNHVRVPGLQIRFPPLPGNTQQNGFRPVGNLVRGIGDVGGRLIETGTAIADTVLSSVRTLFTPPTGVNRVARRRFRA